MSSPLLISDLWSSVTSHCLAINRGHIVLMAWCGILSRMETLSVHESLFWLQIYHWILVGAFLVSELVDFVACFLWLLILLYTPLLSCLYLYTAYSLQDHLFQLVFLILCFKWFRLNVCLNVTELKTLVVNKLMEFVQGSCWGMHAPRYSGLQEASAFFR